MVLAAALCQDSGALPRPADPERAARTLAGWREAAGRADDPELAAFVAASADDPCARALIDAAAGNSPYLAAALLRDPAATRAILEDGPEAAVAAALASLAGGAPEGESRAACMRRMRLAKGRIALAVALADIAGAWALDRVTGALTDAAEATLGAAVGHLLAAGAAAGEIALPDPADPAQGSGYIVLGMGKLGGRELNYSSDIDLIVLYDPDIVRYVGRDEPGPFFVRLTRNLVGMMEERTADGYAFRTDLRLRPDPGSTPPAISTLAAEIYYESAGPELGARGDDQGAPGGRRSGGRRRASSTRCARSSGARISTSPPSRTSTRSSARSTPIAAARHIAVAGHNVKLGRGGIREIEFFAQTQQLIWGGREPALRRRPTCEALGALAALGHIELADGERPDALLRLPAQARAPAADGQRPADPRAAQGRRGDGRDRRLHGLSRPGDLRRRAGRRAAHRSRSITPTCSRRRRRSAGRATWCSPAPRTIRTRSRRWPAWAIASRPGCARSCAPGTAAAIARRAARGRASCSPS